MAKNISQGRRRSSNPDRSTRKLKRLGSYRTTNDNLRDSVRGDTTSRTLLLISLSMRATGRPSVGFSEGRSAGSASFRTGVDRALGDLVPPFLLLRGPDLGASAVDAGKLSILVEKQSPIGRIRSLLTSVGGEGIGWKSGSTPGFGFKPPGILPQIARDSTASLCHDFSPPRSTPDGFVGRVGFVKPQIGDDRLGDSTNGRLGVIP